MRALGNSISILMIMVVLGCASNPKPKYSDEEIKKLDELISGKSFEIKANWARPLVTNSLNSIANAGLLPWGSTANMIDISGSNGYVRMVGDTVMGNLPYFGERQISGTYNNTNNGIKFKGVPKTFEMSKNMDDKGYKFDFLITSDTETYNVTVSLYPNRKSLININSSHRTTISYRGRVLTFPYD